MIDIKEMERQRKAEYARKIRQEPPYPANYADDSEAWDGHGYVAADSVCTPTRRETLTASPAALPVEPPIAVPDWPTRQTVKQPAQVAINRD